MHRFGVFRELLPGGVGTPALSYRAIQPAVLPRDGVFLAGYNDPGDYGVLTPAMAISGGGIVKRLVAVITTEGHRTRG